MEDGCAICPVVFYILSLSRTDPLRSQVTKFSNICQFITVLSREGSLAGVPFCTLAPQCH